MVLALLCEQLPVHSRKIMPFAVATQRIALLGGAGVLGRQSGAEGAARIVKGQRGRLRGGRAPAADAFPKTRTRANLGDKGLEGAIVQDRQVGYVDAIALENVYVPIEKRQGNRRNRIYVRHLLTCNNLRE